MKFNYLMFNNSMALVYSSGIPIVKQGAVSVGRFSLLSSSRTEIENCRSGVDVVVIKMVGLGRETYVVSFFLIILKKIIIKREKDNILKIILSNISFSPQSKIILKTFHYNYLYIFL